MTTGRARWDGLLRRAMLSDLHPSVCAGQTLSRLSESNRRPVHYEGPQTRRLGSDDVGLVSADLQISGSAVGWGRSESDAVGSRLAPQVSDL
jgi:hypothetical protein